MPDSKVLCSERVHSREVRLAAGFPCSRAAVVTREGKPYCTQHDPERIKERYEAKAKIDSLVCHYNPRSFQKRSWCGQPAVGEDKFGEPRCALHTEEALAADKRLRDAAPQLLAALDIVMRQASGVRWEKDVPAPIFLSPEEFALLRTLIQEARGQDA